MRGYVNAVRNTDVTRSEKLKCLAVVAKKFKQPARLARGW